MDKRLQKVALASVVTLFSTTVLSSFTAYQANSLLASPVVYADTEEPPADEDIPDANELKAINEAKQLIQDIRDWIADGETDFAKEDFAKLESENLPALKNIPNIDKKAPGLLADIEKLRSEVYGTTPTPTPTPTVETKTAEIPVTTTYKEDTTLEYGQRNTVQGTAGTKTWQEQNGQVVAGSEKTTKEMVPTVITVGTKPTVTTATIPAPADVEEQDATLDKGQRVLKTAAETGVKTTTVSYSFDANTGVATPKAPVTVTTKEAKAAVYRVGTKAVVGTRTEEIPVTTTYIADPTAEANTQTVVSEGEAGVKTYTTTDGVEDKGVVTKEMKPRQVKVGTKATVVTEEVDAPADITEPDSTLGKGLRVLKTPAVKGTKTTTTTYTLDAKTGKAVAGTPTVTVKQGTAAVYRLGTKIVSSTRTEEIPVTTTYIADPTAEANTQTVVSEGEAGETTYTTTDGVEDAGVVTKAMKPREVKVGTKASVVTVDVAAPADVEEQDATLDKGQRVLKTPAVKGTKTTTTTYTLDAKTGKAVAGTPTVTVKQGTAAVYRVGTKAVVSTRVEPIAITTVYTEDPTAEANTQTVVSEGEAGETTYTTTDGVEDAGVVTKAMKPREVKVGTKASVVTVDVAAPADVEEQDATLDKGQRVLKTPAVKGTKTTTTTYTLDTTTGKAVANEPTVEEIPGTAAVYRVGTKTTTPWTPIVVPVTQDEVKTEPVAFNKVTRENPNLPKGQTRVVQSGKDGVRTVTYTVTTVDGVETKRVLKSDEVTTPAVDEITEVGTKVETPKPDQPQAPNTAAKNDAPATNNTNKNVLPQTGEQTSILAAAGAVLLAGLAGVLNYRRKKE